jgi:hypothetical protein
MDPFLIKIFTTAGIASTAAICAMAIDRFRNVPAGCFALAGAVVPWLVIAILFRWSHFNSVTLVAFFCIVPLFLLAFLCYSFEEPSTTRNIAAAATVGGGVSAIIFCAFIAYPFLMRGE